VGRWLALVALAAGCSSPPSGDTPAGALRLFVESVERARQSLGPDRDAALEQALELVDEASRAEIEERTRGAESLGARDLEPFELLAAYPRREGAGALPTRASAFREHLDPDGTHATVSVRSPTGAIEVPMVREGDAWRVVLSIPAASAGPPCSSGC
jgi:hypothetical protein